MKHLSFIKGNKKLPVWQQNLRVLWFGNFVAGLGFSLITPFMSLFIDTLGNFSRTELNLWSGVTFSSTFLITAIVSPIWGKLADQHGRKIMMLRASLGMAIIIAMMSFVTSVGQLIALRALQGVFSGFISNSNALLATSAPKEKSGQALGTLTTGTVTGTLLGPLFGGVIAEVFGYRVPFLITGGLLFIAFLLTVFFVHEEFTPIAKKDMVNASAMYKTLKYPHLIMGMFITTLIVQASNNSVNPILSLYVRQLMGGGGGVALVSGIVSSLPGIATLLAAPRFGAWGDRIGTHKILLGGLIFGVLVFIPQAFVTNVYQLGFLRLLVGISDAAMLPQIQTLLAKYSPYEATGRIFSYNQSFQAAGNVVGPMLGSGVSGVFGYSAVFISTSILVFANFVLAFFNTREIRDEDD